MGDTRERDLKYGFRHIPVATSNQWLLGFYCDESYWMERYLLFGLRTSPFLFDLFARALNWIMIAILGWSFVLQMQRHVAEILTSFAVNWAW